MYLRFSEPAVFLTLCTTLAALFGMPAAALGEPVVIRQETVIHVNLTEPVSSRTASRGERIDAILDDEDRSGLPPGTRFEGIVTEVRRAMNGRPALLDMVFHRAILPDGVEVRISADLASLSSDNVRNAPDGRLESRRTDPSLDWKWVGYGAERGPVLGEVLGDDFLKGSLMGGRGGAVYAYLNRGTRDRYQEVELARGSDFGIHLHHPVSFEPKAEYWGRDRDRNVRERVLGSRNEYRLERPSVSMAGQVVQFRDAQPMRVNGTMYVPLQALAENAGWTLDYLPGADDFTLRVPDGMSSGQAGTRIVNHAGRTYLLDAAPLSIGGEIYVPLEYASRVGGIPVRLDRGSRQSNGTNLATTPQRQNINRTNVATTPQSPDVFGPNMATIPQRPDINRLVQGLDTIPFSDLKAGLLLWRRVDVRDLHSLSERRLLRTLIADDSVARGNQSLITGLLRNARLITNTQTVVGVSIEDQIIYID